MRVRRQATNTLCYDKTDKTILAARPDHALNFTLLLHAPTHGGIANRGVNRDINGDIHTDEIHRGIGKIKDVILKTGQVKNRASQRQGK